MVWNPINLFYSIHPPPGASQQPPFLSLLDIIVPRIYPSVTRTCWHCPLARLCKCSKCFPKCLDIKSSTLSTVRNNFESESAWPFSQLLSNKLDRVLCIFLKWLCPSVKGRCPSQASSVHTFFYVMNNIQRNFFFPFPFFYPPRLYSDSDMLALPPTRLCNCSKCFS